MQEKPSYYAIIPAEVRYDNDLKPNEKLLYGEITALTNQNKICTASNKYFADLYKAEPETVSRWISNLVSKGYLKSTLVKENGVIKSRELCIDKKINTYCQKNQEGIDKKIKENNTRYLIYIENIFNKLNIQKKMFFDDKELNNAYLDYLKMRFKKGAKYTLDEEQISRQLKKYSKYDKQQLINALEESTMNGWLGIFIKKQNGQAVQEKLPNWYGKEIKKEEMTPEEESELKKELEEFN